VRRSTPNRSNVLFFESHAQAELEGFRPCFRCSPKGEGYSKRRLRLVEKVCQYISDNPEPTLSLQQLSARFKVSSSHLQRLFTVTLGVSPREFQETCRIEALKRMPRKGSPVTSAIFNSDFGSVSRVYEKINVHLGMTPSTYSHGGRGVKRRRSNMPHCQPDRWWVQHSDQLRQVVTVMSSLKKGW
jgi:AraC family transcriptional regulator, regulatory protein of adaptative response / methylated-DNA-[protein]-cysteine methyltransferase